MTEYPLCSDKAIWSVNDFKSFINTAHNLGIGVILDVVYNHLGPDGNYLGKYSDSYTTDKYKN
jgi:maltooligosyltrehalose trehalohydrolase